MLALPAEEKALAFAWSNRIPNPVLGASLLSLTSQSRTLLTAPWPELVIGMGRRVAPIARWIRKRSGGRTRVVLLGRKGPNNMQDVDLAVLCAHFRLPEHPRRQIIVTPPTQVHADLLVAELERHGDPMPELAKPRALFLIGGPTAQHRLTPGFARRMVAEVAAAAERTGLSLAIVTSRRTPTEAVLEIENAAPNAHLHVWQQNRKDNPYLAYLAAADCIVVTGESESMLAEAVATAKPLTIYPLDNRPPTPKQRLCEAVVRAADGTGPSGVLGGRLLDGGWVTPVRDLSLMHRHLDKQGQAQLFEGEINRQPPRESGEMAEVLSRLRALLRDPSA
jgi:mitochondrial fission protein ELM1